MKKLTLRHLIRFGKSFFTKRHNSSYRKYSDMNSGEVQSNLTFLDSANVIGTKGVETVKEYNKEINHRISEELEVARWEMPLLPQFLGTTTLTSTWKEITGNDYAKDIDIPLNPIMGALATSHNNSGTYDVANDEIDVSDFTDGFDTIRSRKMSAGLDAYGYHTPEPYWYIDRMRVSLFTELRDAIHVGHTYKLVLSAGVFKDIEDGYDVAYSNWGAPQGITYDSSLYEENIRNGTSRAYAYMKGFSTNLDDWNSRYIIMSDGVKNLKVVFDKTHALTNVTAVGAYIHLSVGTATLTTVSQILEKMEDGFDAVRAWPDPVNIECIHASGDACSFVQGYAGVGGSVNRKGI